MDAEFWHARWREERIPFHEGRPNRWLVEHFGRLGVAPGATVFVPLCGKAVDMRWLLDRGYGVLGVEVSPIAVRAFFEENGLGRGESPDGDFVRHEGEGATLLCGDFFALDADRLAHVGAIYDRASYIAFDRDARRRYAGHLCAIAPRGAPVLLLTVEYEQERMQGPPFSVGPREVRAAFGSRYRVEHVHGRESIDDAPHLRERGLESLTAHSFVLL